MNMRINKLHTPYNKTNANRGKGTIKYIVIHYVGATGDAKNNCKYYANSKVGASAHYFVGFAGDIWQSVADKNIAWHCGGYVYPGTKHPAHGKCANSNSIGIEMCVRYKNGKWYFEDKTVDAAVKLTRYLMDKYDIPVSHVVRHHDVTGKDCPNPYVKNIKAWNKFKTRLSYRSVTIKKGVRVYKKAVIGTYLRETDKSVKVTWMQDTGAGMSKIDISGDVGYVYNSSISGISGLSKLKTAKIKKASTIYGSTHDVSAKKIKINKKAVNGKIAVGEKVTINGTSGRYTRVRYKGTWGWVLTSHIKNNI